MAWGKFLADFDWPKRSNAHVAYKAGRCYSVPRACLEAAVAEGKAEEIETPSRSTESADVAVEARDEPPGEEHVE